VLKKESRGSDGMIGEINARRRLHKEGKSHKGRPME